MVKTREELGLAGLTSLLDVLPTGSRHIVSPPVTATDDDYVLLVDDVFSADTWLEANGFVKPAVDDEQNYDHDEKELMFTYRKGELNLIVVESSYFFHKWHAATYLARRFNLVKKEDRVALFKYILYGET